MTFFPAALALFLEVRERDEPNHSSIVSVVDLCLQVCPDNPENMTWHIDELARGLQEEERKPNPVVQRVKVIMSLGLVVVHLHSRFLSQVTGVTFGFPSSSTTPSSSSSAIVPNSLPDHHPETDQVSLQQYLWWKLFNFSLDQVVTISLVAVLLVKYIFFDKNIPSPRESTPSSPPSSLPQTPLIPYTADLTTYYFERRRSLTTPPTSIATNTSHCYSSSATNTSLKDEKRGMMVASDNQVSDRSPPVVSKHSVAVQTDPPAVASFMFDRDSLSDEEGDEESGGSRRVSEVRTPRSVEECLRIFKSEVS